MCNLAARNRSDLRRFEGHNRSGVPIQGEELDLARLAITVDVHHRADIPRFQIFSGNGNRQYDALVFIDRSCSVVHAGTRSLTASDPRSTSCAAAHRRRRYASSVRSRISKRNCQPSNDRSIRPNSSQVNSRPSINTTGSGSGSCP